MECLVIVNKMLKIIRVILLTLLFSFFAGCVRLLPFRKSGAKTEIGIASWYGGKKYRKLTASGEWYNPKRFTAAHPTFPFGTKVLVTNLENKKKVVVTINDRGPSVEGRIIDLSYAAAKKLDIIRTGTAKVKLKVLSFGK